MAHKYSAHSITILPLRMSSSQAEYSGSTLPYSYVPYEKVPASDHMTFWERAISTTYYISEVVLNQLIYKKKQARPGLLQTVVLHERKQG